MKRLIYCFCFIVAVVSANPASSQGLFKKLKDKVNNAVNSTVDKKTGVTPPNGSESSNSSGNPVNKGGGGLSNTTPPDVKAQMADAETAHAAKNYSESRYALQQALMGVEIQLGHQVLKSLPLTADALNADTARDVVMSTQWGWSNMSIQRIWKDKADKQLTMTIGNAGVYAGIASIYFANAGAIEASNSKQNIKQVRVEGNKAVIQYEDSKGYTLIVSLGQSSMIVWECINFANETEVMNTANSFDIDGIKKMLGEK